MAMSRSWMSSICMVLAGAFLSASTFERESKYLYKGDPPSTKELKKLKEKGIKTLINVRTNPMPKLERKARRLGMHYFQVKTGAFLSPGREEIDDFLEIVKNPNYRSFYVFCMGGRDRSGFYSAVYKVAVDGWTAEDAIDELRKDKVRFWLPGCKNYESILRNISKSQNISSKELPLQPKSVERSQKSSTLD